MKKLGQSMLLAYLIPALVFCSVRFLAALTFFAFGPGSGIPFISRLVPTVTMILGNMLGSVLWPVSLALKGEMTFFQWLVLPWASV
jgi:hypothetical protein